MHFNICYIRGEREKMLAKTEMEDLQNQLEQMTKSKVIIVRCKSNIISSLVPVTLAWQ